MRKRFLVLTLAAALFTGGLVGCGSNSTGGGEASKEPVNLVWYTIGAPQADDSLVEEKINEYIVDKIGATVSIKRIDFGDYDQKMNVIVNSGEPYDIAFTCSWANNYNVNARKGAFKPLNDLVEEHGKEVYEAVDERFWEGTKIDGEIYGVPTSKEIGLAPYWIFNKELVEKYDVPYEEIKTADDLEPWLKLISEKEKDVVPLFLTNDFGVPVAFDKVLKPLGINLVDGELKVENMFETEETVNFVKKMNEFYENGYINKDAAVNTDTAKRNTYEWFVTKADGQPFAENIWSENFGVDVVVTPASDPYVTTESTTGAMNAISSQSEHPEEAMKFLNLLNTDEYLRTLAGFGIEGTHYNMVDGKLELTGARDRYTVPTFAQGNLFITPPLVEEPENKWEVFKEFNDNSKTSPALGFSFNTESVSTEVAAIANVMKEYEAILVTGSVNAEETLAEMNKKLKDVGLDKVQAEMQKQLDEWSKNNK
ncbi:ABC transporter substrate-binding protein [Clostridium sp. B9]|uniref:ABC transporter substrate-binding protein n=1 Tax=Clostridium sp. B9 TaxID=3423224 RepID=UPI003D2F49D8